MVRAAKRRSLLPGEEASLYDVTDELDIEEEETQEEQTNGTGPVVTEIAYVESRDEEELRAIISNIDDAVEIVLDVPEWKTKEGKIVQVLLRSMTTRERTQFMTEMQKVNWALTKLYPDLVILSARHPVTGRLLFKAQDRGMLLLKMGKAMERIALKVADINGLSEDSLKDIRGN